MESLTYTVQYGYVISNVNEWIIFVVLLFDDLGWSFSKKGFQDTNSKQLRRLVLISDGFWNLLGLFVQMRSIQEALFRSFKQVEDSFPSKNH